MMKSMPNLRILLKSGDNAVSDTIIMYKSALDEMSQDENGLLLVKQWVRTFCVVDLIIFMINC